MTTQNFDTDAMMDMLDQAIGEKGGLTGGARKATTIEEALSGQSAKEIQSVGVQGEGRTIPVPRSDMTLKEIAKLTKALGAVIDKGGYLYEWTGGEAAKNKTLSAREIGFSMMTDEERTAYDWWMENGNKKEYDGGWGEVDLTVPVGKELKYRHELAALRHMYGNKDLVLRNWAWLRQTSDARAHVVWAISKILKAAEDLAGGLKSDNPLILAEYQTSNKIISETSTFIKKFMEEVHKLLRPIDTSLNKIIARRNVMKKELGFDVKKEGTANNIAKKYGKESVGIIRPSEEGPRGVKRQREETITIAELRKLKIQKSQPVDVPARDPVPAVSHVDREGEDLEMHAGDVQELTGQTHKAVVPNDIGDRELQAMLQGIKNTTWETALDKYMAALPDAGYRRAVLISQIEKAIQRKATTITTPSTASNMEKFLFFVFGAAMHRKHITASEIRTLVGKHGWLDAVKKAGWLVTGSKTKTMLADVPNMTDM